jgi:hypothetical protein
VQEKPVATEPVELQEKATRPPKTANQRLPLLVAQRATLRRAMLALPE